MKKGTYFTCPPWSALEAPCYQRAKHVPHRRTTRRGISNRCEGPSALRSRDRSGTQGLRGRLRPPRHPRRGRGRRPGGARARALRRAPAGSRFDRVRPARADRQVREAGDSAAGRARAGSVEEPRARRGRRRRACTRAHGERRESPPHLGPLGPHREVTRAVPRGAQRNRAMSRTRTFFTLVFPSMIAGGVLFCSAFGHADSCRVYGNEWPSSDATVVAQVDPRHRPRPMVPPVPPVPPVPAVPPVPPVPGHHRHSHSSGGGINIQMHDGKLQVDGVNDIVESSIRSAQDSIRTSILPQEVKDKLQRRLDKQRETVENRLSHLDATDLDQLGEELGKMGEDIGREMGDFGKDMDKYGEKMSKDAAKQWGKQWGKDWSKKWKFNGNDCNDSDADNDYDDDQASVDVDDQDDVDV